MTIGRRNRPFSWLSLTWTDTGERPWWWCLLGAALQITVGLTCYYDGDTIGTCLFLISAGVNLGMGGRVDRDKARFGVTVAQGGKRDS